MTNIAVSICESVASASRDREKFHCLASSYSAISVFVMYESTPQPPPPLPQKKEASLGDSAGVRMLIPVGRSGWAIAAGYLGLFSLVILPAPLALIISLIAIRDIRKSVGTNHVKHGMGRAIFGLVMGILGTIILLLSFIPMFLKGT
jgi:Domain of unknown function (DUF4190)